MPANFASLEAMAPELRQAIHRLEAAASLMYEDIDARGKKVWRYPDAIVGWMNQIAREITPIIRRFIIQNYIGSGLAKNTNSRYQHTGKLASALQRIIIIPKLRTIRRRNDANIESITFHVRMPPNIPPYEYTPKTQRGQQRRSDFYKVAAALNYGAVRMPNIWRETIDLPTGRRGWVYAPMVGGSAKRTLKQYAITGRASKRALKRIETGTESRQWGGKIIGGYQIGAVTDTPKSAHLALGGAKVVVIKPFGFFRLTEAQRREVEEHVRAALLTRYLEMLR